MYKLDRIMHENLIDRIKILLKDEFEYSSEDKEEFGDFIYKHIQAAKNLEITNEDSICAFVVLSFLNGENFLNRKEFKVYNYYLRNKFYDPNEFIFEIPLNPS